MSLRTFLFAADALRIEEDVRFHVKTESGVAMSPVPSPADVKAQNKTAMQNLMTMMAGVKGAPGGKR